MKLSTQFNEFSKSCRITKTHFGSVAYYILERTWLLLNRKFGLLTLMHYEKDHLGPIIMLILCKFEEEKSYSRAYSYVTAALLKKNNVAFRENCGDKHFSA